MEPDLAIAPFTPACSEGGRKICVLDHGGTRSNRSNPSKSAGYGRTPLLAAGTAAPVFLPSTLHVYGNEVKARFDLELLILALAVFAGAIIWNRTKDPAQAIAYGAAVVLVFLVFLFSLPLLSGG